MARARQPDRPTFALYIAKESAAPGWCRLGSFHSRWTARRASSLPSTQVQHPERPILHQPTTPAPARHYLRSRSTASSRLMTTRTTLLLLLELRRPLPHGHGSAIRAASTSPWLERMAQCFIPTTTSFIILCRPYARRAIHTYP